MLINHPDIACMIDSSFECFKYFTKCIEKKARRKERKKERKKKENRIETNTTTPPQN